MTKRWEHNLTRVIGPALRCTRCGGKWYARDGWEKLLPMFEQECPGAAETLVNQAQDRPRY